MACRGEHLRLARAERLPPTCAKHLAARLGYDGSMRKTAALASGILCIFGALLGRDYGPALGSRMPDFTLRDQNGQPHSLQSLLGPKGAVILFFRSADW